MVGSINSFANVGVAPFTTGAVLMQETDSLHLLEEHSSLLLTFASLIVLGLLMAAALYFDRAGKGRNDR